MLVSSGLLPEKRNRKEKGIHCQEGNCISVYFSRVGEKAMGLKGKKGRGGGGGDGEMRLADLFWGLSSLLGC